MNQDNLLRDDIEQLRKRLREAEDLIDAIRTGRIDALVVSSSGQDGIYTLTGADHTYRVLIETMDEGALILSAEGTILYCNRSFADMLGTVINEVIGNTIGDLISGADREKFKAVYARVSAIDGVKAEINMQSDHSGVIPALVSLRTLLLDGLQTVCMVVTDLTEQKKAEITLRSYSQRLYRQNAELKWRAEQLARLSSQLTMAEQRERRRLADLLHDHLQQLLAGAKLNLDFVSHEHAPAQHQAFKDAYKLLTQSLEASRTLCVELSPPVLYMHGLSEGLQWLTRWMQKTHKLRVELHPDPRIDAIQEDIKVLLFQSVRELLFNVVKHAGTSMARVVMQRRSDRIIITVSDKGSGFAARELWNKGNPTGGGYGLFNIRERLLLLGGAFDIESAPGRGTSATLTTPMQTSASEQPLSGAALPGEPQRPLDDSQPEAPVRTDSTIQVMLVDDHAVMRQGLSLVLSRHDDIEVVGEAADGGQAVEMARRMNPDIILMDISMPVMDGIEATRIIRSQMPRIQIIGLSMHDADDQAAAMQQAGAVAYLNKSGAADTIVHTIRRHVGGNGSNPI